MGKKRKSQTSRQSTNKLVAQAQSHLQAGRFREAIDVYKQLLKREQRPQWREALADAYLGRAEQLAAKGMYKEAAALWENMAGLCGARRLDWYIDWLLQGGRHGRGARLFAEADPAFRESPAGSRLAARLAGLLVCDYGEIVETLPVDSPLLQQRDSMLAAMRAYCLDDDAAMKESLKAIPFRSPYRDLRLVLQGLAALAVDPQTTLAQLNKVADDSPFARLAGVVRTALLDDDALLAAIARLHGAEREFVLTLRGWGEGEISLVRHLPDVREADARALFKLAIGVGDQLEASRLQRFCLQLLPHYPQGLPAFEKRFGPLPLFERERIHALAAEQRHDFDGARNHWQACVEHLRPSGIGSDDVLRAALILRHLADLTFEELGSAPWAEDEVQQYLARSLELDPEDKPTYLKLMGIAQKRDDTKAHDHWAERAVQQFPEDADILMAAGMGAYRRGAFKKAAGFARTLLERDPINPHARSLLISCHLAHARKQIKAGKPALAERELTEAARYAREDDQRGIIELNQGFLALVQGLDQEAEPLLQRGLQDLGGGLVAQFRFLVDGRRLEIAQRTLTRHYNRIKGQPSSPAPKDIVQVAELLHRYVDDGVEEIPEILECLRKPLKAAAELEFSEQELRVVLGALQKTESYSLLKDYAEAAMRRFGRQPRFFYYYVFGRTKGQSDRLTPLEEIQLQSGLDQALEAEDRETATLIEDFLGLPDFMPMGLPPLPPDMEQVMDELMDFLNTDDPEEVLAFLEERLREEGGFPPFPLPFPKGRLK